MLVRPALGRAVYWREGRGKELIWKRNIPRSTESTNIGTMLIFHAEECPNASTDDLGEGNEETENSGVLKLRGEDCVKDPVEAEDGIDYHGEVVNPWAFVAEDVTEKGVLGIWIAQTYQVSACGK